MMYMVKKKGEPVMDLEGMRVGRREWRKEGVRRKEEGGVVGERSREEEEKRRKKG